MKRFSILLLSSVLLLSSCQTLTKTARTAEVSSSLHNATVVDIVPATEHRVTYTLEPSEALQRGGVDNIRQAAESEVLVKYGNADVLLEPQYVITKKQGLLRSKVTSITVSGRPAYYTNFRTLHDSVWCNPVYRGVYQPKTLSFVANKRPLAGLRKSQPSLRSSSVSTRGFTKGVSFFLGNDYQELDLNVGFQFNPYFEVGASIGSDAEFADVSLCGYARVNLSKNKRHFFLEAKYGGYLYGYMQNMMRFGFGYCFGKVDLAFQTLSYDYESYQYNRGYYDSYYGGYYGGYGYYETRSYTDYGISLTLRF